MLLILGRVILFSLLVLDWADDPCHGQSVLSSRYSSQEVIPFGLVFRQAISADMERVRHVQSLSAEPVLLPLCAFLPLENTVASVHAGLLVSPYELMSLQC